MGEKRGRLKLFIFYWVRAYFGHCFILFEEDGEGVGRAARNPNFHPCNKHINNQIIG